MGGLSMRFRSKLGFVLALLSASIPVAAGAAQPGWVSDTYNPSNFPAKVQAIFYQCPPSAQQCQDETIDRGHSTKLGKWWVTLDSRRTAMASLSRAKDTIGIDIGGGLVCRNYINNADVADCELILEYDTNSGRARCTLSVAEPGTSDTETECPTFIQYQ